MKNIHWGTLLVGVALGLFVVPRVTSMVKSR